MRASRLLSILILLQLKGRASATDLAREFEVSVRTIYRDIDQLSAAGVPVYAERGRAGGFALLDGYRTRLTGFTPAEAEALLLAGVGDAAADLGIGAEAAAAQLKMLASLPRDSGASALAIAARFHLDPAPWYARTETIPCLPRLADAVWRAKRVRIRYDSWNGVVTRDVDPLGLVLKGGVWYLVAAAKSAGKPPTPRTYRASNIASLKIRDQTFKRPARFNLAKYWAAWARDFETRLFSARATVRLTEEGMRMLRAAHPIAAEAASAAKPAANGWRKADIPLEEGAHGVRLLLSLGAEAEVIAPKALRAAIAAEAKRVAARYASP